MPTSQQQSASDPNGFLGGMTVVKVEGTSRADLNGQLGMAVEYKVSTGRYMVHLSFMQTIVALKPGNLVRASTFETYKSQFDQITKNPGLRQEFMRYYNNVQAKLPPGLKPEYAAVAILLILIVAVYFLGFTKILMAISMVLLILLIMGPDIMAGHPPKTMIQYFPSRCRQTIEQSFPMLKGRYLTDKVAAGIVIIMLIICARALFANPKAAARANATSSPPPSREILEQAYKLGFDDATNANEFGASLPKITEKVSHRLELDNDDFIPDTDDPNAFLPPPPKKSGGFGMSQMMSIFYLYRTATQLGADPVTGRGFSMERLIANARSMQVWQMGIMGFSLYNLVRTFI